jgi:hypothetical protein
MYRDSMCSVYFTIFGSSARNMYVILLMICLARGWGREGMTGDSNVFRGKAFEPSNPLIAI